MDIYLLRHTEPALPPGTCYGRLDPDVKSDFEKETKRIRQQIPQNGYLLYSSPLKRCRKMAEALFLSSGADIRFDDRLMEMDMGRWEGMKWHEIPKEEIDSWAKDVYRVPTPGGESFQDIYTRALSFLRHLATLEDQTIVITTHSGIIRSFLHYALQIPVNRLFHLILDYGSLTRCSIETKGRGLPSQKEKEDAFVSGEKGQPEILETPVNIRVSGINIL